MRARPFLERDADADPLRQFGRWFEQAQVGGVRVPEAAALATATVGGAPSARMVLVKAFDERGFAFYTGHESRKGRELAENPRAALLFSWDALGRQVRIEGRVERVDRDESAAYFRTRPRESQLAAWASRQSEPIQDRDELEAAFADAARRFAGREVPLPPRWGGYRLRPSSYEFWQHRDSRLHDRLRYLEGAEGAWTRTRLAP